VKKKMAEFCNKCDSKYPLRPQQGIRSVGTGADNQVIPNEAEVFICAEGCGKYTVLLAGKEIFADQTGAPTASELAAQKAAKAADKAKN